MPATPSATSPTIRARRAARALALSLPVLAAACTISPGPGRPDLAGPPVTTRVEGNWASADGASIATFQNGAFVNRASDTGRPFTSGGRYTYEGGERVGISFTSLISQRQIVADCLAVNAAQLNCTNEEGTRFSLFRRA